MKRPKIVCGQTLLGKFTLFFIARHGAATGGWETRQGGHGPKKVENHCDKVMTLYCNSNVFTQYTKLLILSQRRGNYNENYDSLWFAAKWVDTTDRELSEAQNESYITTLECQHMKCREMTSKYVNIPQLNTRYEQHQMLILNTISSDLAALLKYVNIKYRNAS